MKEDFNKLRTIAHKLVTTDFKYPWQFRLEIKDAPKELDFYVKDYHIFGLQIFFIIESVLRYSVIPLFAGISSRKYVSPATLFTNVLSTLSGRHAIRIQEGNRQEVIIGRKRLRRWW